MHAATPVALAAVLYLPAAADLSRFAPLGVAELGVAPGTGVLGIAWLEVLKGLKRRLT
jgi:hypothetical protein